MPRILSTNLLIEKNRIESSHVWTLLFEINIAGAPAPFRLAAYDQDVNFHGLVFSAFALEVDALEEPTHGALVNLRVNVTNVDQQMIALLENYWVTTGTPQWDIRAWTIDCQQPNETPLGAAEIFTVQQVATDYVMATFDLVAEGLSLAATIPKRRFTASSGFPNLPRSGR